MPAADADWRLAGRDALSLALIDARNHTLALLADVEAAVMAVRQPPPAPPGQPQPPARPDAYAHEWPQWLRAVGRIGWFQEYWIARNTRRALGRACGPAPTRLASIEPHADDWWQDPAGSPVTAAEDGTRAHLPPVPPLPDVQALRGWLLETLEATLDLLERASDDEAGLCLLRAVLQHEDSQAVALRLAAHHAGLPLAQEPPPALAPREPLWLPPTRHRLGRPMAYGFAADDERPVVELAVPEFEIDAAPVTWAQFTEFVEDGGYDRRECWSSAGWNWLQAQAERDGRRAPRHVEQIGASAGGVLQTWFGRTRRMAVQQPALHVSWHEADAWCRWAGRRLPSEVEWDVAARSASSRGFAWGQVLEWTASGYRPYGDAPDAVWSPDPWRDASALPCDGSGRVLRGTPWLARERQRSVHTRHGALPGDDSGFVGFRSCAL